MNPHTELSRQELEEKVASVPFWFHTFDLGRGVRTPGAKSLEVLESELRSLHLPDLRGKTVLDIGAWDGFFTFEAERRGARRVVALDHFVWQRDYDTGRGMLGKLGFDTIHELKRSRAESVYADYMEVDFKSLGGPFDVTFYFGVLYHMENPLVALRRVAEATRDLAIIETHAVEIPALPGAPLCEFYETTELNGDPTNWWGPTAEAVAGMCRAAGFDRVEVVAGPGRRPPRRSLYSKLRVAAGHALRELGLKRRLPAEVRHYRLYAHAWK